MYKIGVIGDYDSICGFSALGLDIFPVSDAEEARTTLNKLASGEYGIIYITEHYINLETMDKYTAAQIPAVVPIPSVRGSSGFGTACVKRYVEQAVGSDIIFNDED